MFKKRFFLFSALLFVTAFQSCEREEDMMSSELQLRVPYKVWKLEGFATRNSDESYFNNKQSYSVQKLESGSLLLLDLKKDGTFVGNTLANKISGDFIFDAYRGTFSFSSFDSTGSEVSTDGVQYVACLKSVTAYAVFEKSLYLYYTKDKTHFLLFSTVE